MTKKIGIADTMFSRVDMFPFCKKVIGNAPQKYAIERYTVPGVKDLPVACKILFEKYRCDIVIALGMSGKMPVDKICTHEASTAIQNAMLMANKHILEVFVHMDEVKNDRELFRIAKNRAEKHTLNALALLKGKEALTHFAGKGKRQGKEDVGGIWFE